MVAPQKSRARPQPKNTTNKKASSKPKQRKETDTAPASASTIPLDLQQLLLNIFKNSFPEKLQSDMQPLLQEVKGHLFNRDFGTAFGKEEYLEAYAARWSPSRALGYLQIFDDLKGDLRALARRDGDAEPSVGERKWKVVCLGGGAGAEIVALAGLRKMLAGDNDDNTKDAPEDGAIEAVAIDMAAWNSVVAKLNSGIMEPPPISAYASAAIKEANTPLLSQSAMEITFHQHDILNTALPTLSPLLQNAHLTTLLFTLNELYTASVSLTQSFLLNLTKILQPGSMLLVVDSPGSYSSVSLNGKEGKYPMAWLLDFTLLGKGGKDGKEGQKGWEKIVEDESKWFRMSEELKYPIELENMRFQIHLYRRV